MKISKEVKIGTFVIFVFIVSFFTINYLRGKDIFNREIELTSSYQNIEGLVASAPVYIKGYKAGKVVDVTYNTETDMFDILCSIKKEFNIPTDSKMTIYSVDIMGGKGVKIDLGDDSTFVNDGGRLTPYFETGLMDGLAAGIGPLLEKVTQTIDSLNVTVSGVNELLSDKNKAAIDRTLAHLESTIRNVRALSADINGKSDELNEFIENLATLSEKLVPVTEKIDSVMCDVSSIVGEISEEDIAELVASLSSLLEKIDDPNGTVGKLLVDGSVYNSVDLLLNDVDSLIRKIQENPKKYLKISVF